MPGTIHVTVLEFKGVSSSGKPSAKSVKVSMGKINHQTWDDKGHFSFALTKLREDLVVSLLDSGGNEIAHTDIRTMQIIEKGSWDDVFSLDGGGHVHLKLQFVLSEEERNRIRKMRESVMKKKLEKSKPACDSAETSPKHQKHNVSAPPKRFSEIDSTMIRKVDAPQAGLSSDFATSFDPNQSQNDMPASRDEHGGEIQRAPSIIEDNDSSSIEKSQSRPKKLLTSSNVRKMITAFENNRQIQVVKSSLKKTQSDPNLSQFKNLQKEALLEEEEREDKSVVSNDPIGGKILGNSKDHQLPLKFQQLTSNNADISSQAMKDSKSLENDSENVKNISISSSVAKSIAGQLDSEDASSSGRIDNEKSQVITKGRGEKTSLKSSTMIDNKPASPKSLQCYIEECDSSQSYGIWIFPDNTRRLCITTAGKQVKKILGEEGKAKNISLELEKTEENEENRVELQVSEVGSSSSDGSSYGIVGQAIKVAVILGFGLLVLLTRQREPPRRGKGEEKADLFTIPDYIDERTLRLSLG